MSVRIKREREDSPESLFMPLDSDGDNSEGERDSAQPPAPDARTTKRRKTELETVPVEDSTEGDEQKEDDDDRPKDTPSQTLEEPRPSRADISQPSHGDREPTTGSTDSPTRVSNHTQKDPVERGAIIEADENNFREGFPHIAAYHHTFVIAEEKATELCDTVTDCIDVLAAAGWQDADVMPFYNELKSCRSPSDSYPPPRIVGFCGSTGKGKSSAMNSVLKVTVVAYVHSGANRGTFVTQEILAAPSMQPPGHTAKVHYLDGRGRMRQLRRFCGHIVRHLNPEETKEDDTDSDDDSDDEEHKCSLEARYDTAVECLQNAFCKESKFATQDSTREYLKLFVQSPPLSRMSTNEQIEQLTKDLQPRLKKLLDSIHMEDDVETIHKFDEQAFQQVLKRRTRAARVDNSEPSPWAFVTKDQILLKDNEMTDANVIFADLPGVGDNNTHVVEHALRGLRRSGTVLVFAAHDERLTASKDLQHHLRTCIEAEKTDIALVLPKIDTMNGLPDDQRELMDEEDRAEVGALEAERKEVEARCEQIETEQEAAEEQGQADKLMSLSMESRQLKRKAKSAKNAVRQAHIKVRCKQLRKVAQGMLQKIDKSKWTPKLKVFPISNEQYQLHLTKPNSKDIFLDLEATGVPALQRHILAAAATGRAENLIHLCTQKLPLLLIGALSVLTKSPVERKDALRKIILKTVDEGQTLGQGIKQDILGAFDETITTSIETNLSAWLSEADVVLTKVGKWPHQSFTAVCKHQGCYKQKKGGKIFNVNYDIFQIIEQGMLTAFNDFGDAFQRVVQDFHTSIRELLNKLRSDLTEGKVVNLGNFESFIKGSLADMQHDMDSRFDTLQKYIHRLRHRMTLQPPMNNGMLDFMYEPDYDDEEEEHEDTEDEVEGGVTLKRHLVGDALVKVYSDCLKAKKGKHGSKHQARLAVLRAFFEDETAKGQTNNNNVFRQMGVLAKAQLEAYLSKWADGTDKNVHAGLARILTGFDARFKTPKAKTKQDQEASERLRKVIEEAIGIADGELRELVEMFSAGEKGSKYGDMLSMSQDMSLRG